MSYFRFSVGCGEEWTRTTELRRGQIYSLLQLPLCDFPISMSQLGGTRADEGTRTPDRLITNQLLYQLSYIGFISLSNNSLFLDLRLQRYNFFPYTPKFFSTPTQYFLQHIGFQHYSNEKKSPQPTPTPTQPNPFRTPKTYFSSPTHTHKTPIPYIYLNIKQLNIFPLTPSTLQITFISCISDILTAIYLTLTLHYPVRYRKALLSLPIFC